MIQPSEIRQVVKGYKGVKVATMGSHSALDVCDGARDEGFETWVYCQQGRDLTYSRYFAKRKLPHGVRGIVERAIVLTKFADILKKDILQEMKDHQVVFVPNHALTSYLSIEDVENRFSVPLFGTRSLLRSEERGGERDYYHLLEVAGLPHPKRISRPEDIDRLAVVKLPHAMMRSERGFFTAASYDEYKQKSKRLVSRNVLTRQDLKSARIEEHVIGPVFDIELFRTPLADESDDEIELIGVDWRF